MGRLAAVDGVRRTSGSVAPTRRGVVALVVAVGCFAAAPALSLPALLQVTALLVGLLVAALVFVLVGHARVAVVRRFAPHVVDPGHRAHVDVRVANLGRLPCLEATWVDPLPQGVTGEARGTLPRLGGRRSATARTTFGYDVHGLRRGQHLIGPMQISLADPFGLMVRRHVLGRGDALTVLPRRVDLPPITVGGSSTEGATHPAPQSVGLGDDDVVARAYLPGDAMKRLHWKATAHRGELMVRQEERQINPRAVVVLDTAAARHGTVADLRTSWGHAPSFEWSVVAVASIVTHLARAGYAVTVRSSDGSIDRVVEEGQDVVEDVMIDLATVQPGVDDDKGLDGLEEALTVVLLGRPDDRCASVLVQAVPGSALALVAMGSPSSALEMLESAGWRVAAYRPGDELVDVWTSLDHRRVDAAR